MLLVSKKTPGEGNFPVCCKFSGPASYPPSRSCSSEPSVGALTNQIVLKFSQRSHQMKDEFSAGCGRI